ncbi:nucleotidyl transferase AbiEii/AbiGii toxin family protein [Candidatus Uhrbacteria bacterium]|nr:nucleotidyl transferase AbiEii/AbiGii toxin family protein [Candidatus Uhrbacteria bacterium]
MVTKAIEKKAEIIFRELNEIPFFAQFYLAGGTALAVQIGHRISFDLDFFSQNFFSVKNTRNGLRSLGAVNVRLEDEHSLGVIVRGVKMSFLEYPYPLLFPAIKWKNHGNLCDIRDIGCMKLDAIASRGTKRDFVDLYFITRKYSLKKLLDLFKKKYKGIEYNYLHLLKSICYFEDAEADPTPKMLVDLSWEKIRANFIKEIDTLSKKV